MTRGYLDVRASGRDMCDLQAKMSSCRVRRELDLEDGRTFVYGVHVLISGKSRAVDSTPSPQPQESQHKVGDDERGDP